MDGGLRHTMNFAPAQYANILFMWAGIKQNTARTAVQRWTDVTAISLWHEQKTNDGYWRHGNDFCSYGRLKEHK